MVDIYLKVDNSDAFLHFLSIPLSDIHRLSIRPLKWIRFVSFSICGSPGDLHEMSSTTAVNALPVVVDYDNSGIVESSTYYYIPIKRRCAFIDHLGLKDQITSSVLTQRQSNFCECIMLRDGEYCVFTRETKESCEAAHIIPRSKGDQYIHQVIEDRSQLYDPSLVPDISGIDDIQNGIFLNKTLHAKFGKGLVAFLQTPNFALNPDDIPTVGQDPTPPSRITLQQLEPPTALYMAAPNCLDANFRGNGDLLPPTILLDYMYGIAAYNRWKAEDIHPVVGQYFSDNFELILQTPLPPQPELFGSDSSGESDDYRDSDYCPDPLTPPMDGQHNPRMRGLEEAMEEVNYLMMYINGITPRALAEKRQAEEAMAQEESRVKVGGWLQRVPVGERPEGAAEEGTSSLQ